MTRIMLCPDSPSLYIKLLISNLKSHGVDVEVIPWFGRQSHMSMMRLKKSIKGGHDLLHLHWMPFNRRPMMDKVKKLCDDSGVRMIWTVHNLIPHVPRYGSEENDIEAMRCMANWAVHGIVHSENIIEPFKQTFRDDLPLTVIPHGHFIDHVKRVPVTNARRNRGLPRDKTILLMFPPNRWNKGIRTFIDVLRQLPDNYMGVMAGRCTDKEIIRFLKESKTELGAKLEIETNFVPKPFAHQYFGASDIFFIPYTNITTSGSAVHAISYGKPIISTKHGNMMDLVESGVNGYLCDSREEMVDRILSISREDAQEMGEKSFLRAKTFDWDDIVVRTIKVYEELR